MGDVKTIKAHLRKPLELMRTTPRQNNTSEKAFGDAGDDIKTKRASKKAVGDGVDDVKTTSASEKAVGDCEDDAIKNNHVWPTSRSLEKTVGDGVDDGVSILCVRAPCDRW